MSGAQNTYFSAVLQQ